MNHKIQKYLAKILLIPMVSFSVFSGIVPFGSMQVQATELVGETETEEETESVFAANKLNYIYLDTKTVYTPSAQTVMVSYGDEQTQLAEAKLTVQNYLTGSLAEYTMVDSFENTATFSLDYVATDRGIYEITDLHIVTTGGYTDQIHLQDTGMDRIYFGVDEEFEETDDADKALTAESYQELTADSYATMQTESESANDSINYDAQSNLQNEDLSQVEFQIVSLGSDASQITTSDINDIKKALEAGDAAANKNARMRMESELSTEAQEYVVMLDPGHDATHGGANKNGLREEVLTLKIAQYCKAELEQYKNVKVYMTRNSAACPLPGSTSVADNLNRVSTAASVGADIYVSIHLNSAGSGTPKGAEVFYPNSNYRPAIGSAGANLATQIQRQLVALGLNNRGISIRNSGDGSRYPDGSLADYYAVIKHSKNAGFPGVIVEHAYVSNASDAAFLKSESNLQALGVADATGIAEYLGLSKTQREVDRAKVEAFVTRLYLKCFGREPDKVGHKDWTDKICNFESDGTRVAYGFFFSEEMMNRALSNDEYVEVLYNVFLNRLSDDAGKADWVYKLENGASRYGVFMGFANSIEFDALCLSYGIDRGNAEYAEGRDRNLGLTTFVSRLYTKALGREYDIDGLNSWCNRVCDNEWTITDVSTTGFFNSPEFLNKNLSNEDYVQVLYQTFFDRESDQTGFDYWINQLENGVSRDEVIKGFSDSQEFSNLKKSYGL